MESFTFLFGLPAWIISLAVFVACLLAAELGYRLGTRQEAGHPNASEELPNSVGVPPAASRKKGHINVVHTVIAALLGLLLAFMVSMAVDRFESRKAAVVDEANAIGTAFLRASMLPQPQRYLAVDDFKRYVDVRLQLVRPDWYLDSASGLRKEATSLQRHLWSLTLSVDDRDNKEVSVGLLLESLNEMIDSAGRRDAGLRNHLPEDVLYLLFLVSLATLAMMGYSSALSGGRSLVAELVIALVLTAVIFIIIDFDRPYRGILQVGQRSMLELRDLMAQGLPLP